jgi:hypothetical protein
MHFEISWVRSKKLVISFASALVFTLTSCGSVASSFDYKTELTNYVEHSDDCGTKTMAPPPMQIGGPTFLSSNINEVKKYWWVEYGEHDYYQYRLEDPSYLEDDRKTSLGFISCSKFLRDEVKGFEGNSDTSYQTLSDLYTQLANNVDSASVIYQAMFQLPNTRASRSKYMELEDGARGLEVVRKDLFLAIRKLIDVTYADDVQIFIERCPIYYNVFGDVTSYNGIVYLKNYGDSAQNVNLTIGYTDDDGVIVGQDYIITTVPAHATMKQTISGSSSLKFPAQCYVQVN